MGILVYGECCCLSLSTADRTKLGAGRGNDALALFHSVILDLHNAVRVGTTAPLHDSLRGETSVVPLILSSFTIALSVNASAVMWELRQPWESTPTLHSFLKIDETPRLELLWRRRRDGSTMLDPQPKNGSSVMSVRWKHHRLLPYTKYGHACEGGKRIGSSCSSGSPLWPYKGPAIQMVFTHTRH